MGAWPLQQEIQTLPPPSGQLVDLRFRALLGEEAWQGLLPAVRKRFSKRLGGDAVALYRGQVVKTHFSPLGWLFAQALRVIGAPLPISRDVGVPAVVTVSEDARSGGQVWSRLYGRRNAFPQVIHSAKRFAGPTGLEEYVGHGVGMALRVEPMVDGLRFVSDHYFLCMGKWRLRMPRILEPGRTVIEHHDHGDGAFAFDLVVRHPLLGLLVEQHALFHDV